MKRETNYPFVLIHGMLGWGKDELLYSVFPYWGMMSGNLMTYLKCQGFEVYNPSVGKYSSTWDRACELYAQLTGGTVDYGIAHSKKYGHDRYGRTYQKPLFEGWGSERKINLIGHSFGGATIRLLTSLLANGSKEEIDATPQNDISPLFTGGKADWVFSITSVACVHEGTTVLYSTQEIMNKLENITYVMANLGSGTAFGDLYEGHMEQWGINGWENGKRTKGTFSRSLQNQIKESHDNVWYDLTLKGAKEVNEKIQCVENVYYFSLPCCKTTNKFYSKGVESKPQITMNPLFKPFSKSIGKYSKNKVNDIKIDEKWLPNDGIVPTISETAPFNEPHMDLHDADEIKKGMWYVYDTFPYDHMGITGGFPLPQSGDAIRKIYFDHFRMICQLKK